MRAIMNPSPEAPAAAVALPDTTPDGQSAKAPAPLKDFQTRFLYPFFFAPHEVKSALAALEAATPPGRSGLWACADPRDAYKEEALDHVAEFLFAADHPTGCRYLKIADAATQPWFQGAKVLVGGGRNLPVRLVPKVQIELFLSHYGVGVLSIALTPFPPKREEGGTRDPADAVEFNYRLAQLQPWSAPQIRLPHPSEDPESLARLTDADREQLPPVPPPDAPLSERLGKRGGVFILPELVAELLRPLNELRLEPVQPTFSVYSVVRYRLIPGVW
jgi:hypothetical protein